MHEEEEEESSEGIEIIDKKSTNRENITYQIQFKNKETCWISAEDFKNDYRNASKLIRRYNKKNELEYIPSKQEKKRIRKFKKQNKKKEEEEGELEIIRSRKDGEFTTQFIFEKFTIFKELNIIYF